MWDFIYDLEFDSYALGVTLFVAVLFGWFFFFDPLNVGMGDLSFTYRFIGWIGGCVVGYFIALRMLS